MLLHTLRVLEVGSKWRGGEAAFRPPSRGLHSSSVVYQFNDSVIEIFQPFSPFRFTDVFLFHVRYMTMQNLKAWNYIMARLSNDCRQQWRMYACPRLWTPRLHVNLWVLCRVRIVLFIRVLGSHTDWGHFTFNVLCILPVCASFPFLFSIHNDEM
jgi:hypothetical protein